MAERRNGFEHTMREFPKHITHQTSRASMIMKMTMMMMILTIMSMKKTIRMKIMMKMITNKEIAILMRMMIL